MFQTTDGLLFAEDKKLYQNIQGRHKSIQKIKATPYGPLCPGGCDTPNQWWKSLANVGERPLHCRDNFKLSALSKLVSGKRDRRISNLIATKVFAYSNN
jgi:hypothetical protein